MELTDTLRALTRRWYVLLLGLCLTAVAGWGAYQAVPTSYQAGGSILLMPSTDTVATNGNPYLYLNGMIDARDVLLRRSGSTENRQAVIGEHTDADYVLSSDPTTQSPIVSVVVESSTPGSALTVMGSALANVQENLAAMQEELGVPEGQRVSSMLLLQDEAAAPSRTTALRAAIVIVGIGSLGTLMLAGLVDNLLQHRRERRAARTEDAGNDGSTPPPEPDADRDDHQQEADPDDRAEEGTDEGDRVYLDDRDEEDPSTEVAPRAVSMSGAASGHVDP